jgi:hypothetical protein
MLMGLLLLSVFAFGIVIGRFVLGAGWRELQAAYQAGQEAVVKDIDEAIFPPISESIPRAAYCSTRYMDDTLSQDG